MQTVAVLFARIDSVYKTLPATDVFDIERDARTWSGGAPIVAHPPCRGWGNLRHFAKPRPDELDLARFAVERIRKWGGVLEHPAGSLLWRDQSLPRPGVFDEFGGFTFPVLQQWWGHKAAKATWLYICGCRPDDTPPLPFVLGQSEKVIAQRRTRMDGTRIRKGDRGWRPEVTKREREMTPPALAVWLCEVARRARRING